MKPWSGALVVLTQPTVSRTLQFPMTAGIGKMTKQETVSQLLVPVEDEADQGQRDRAWQTRVDAANARVQELEDRLDLMVDEFLRIRSCPMFDNNMSEIQGLCDRAVARVKQWVPVIEQRDKAIAEKDALKREVARLCVAVMSRDNRAVHVWDDNGRPTVVCSYCHRPIDSTSQSCSDDCVRMELPATPKPCRCVSGALAHTLNCKGEINGTKRTL